MHSLVLKVLKEFVKDKKLYWRKEDDLILKKIKESGFFSDRDKVEGI